MQDGDGGEVDVIGVPDVTHDRAEQPGVSQLHGHTENHRGERHQHVSERQRHHEVVGDYAQLAKPEKCRRYITLG